MSDHNIIVIGGGIAGIAATWRLQGAGAQVTLLEAKPYLGGRLASHSTPDLPTPFDNGPHLFLSTYMQARKLFRELGISDDFEYPYPGAIPFVRPDGWGGVLREWPLPAPYNLAAGLLAFPILTLKSRLRSLKLARGLLVKQLPRNQSAGEWLTNHSEPEERSVLWEPLIQAVVNSDSEVVPADYLRIVLKQGFCRGFWGGRLGQARKPLGRIFGDNVRVSLEAAGVKVILKAHSSGVVFENGKITGVRLKDGETIPCQAVVAALPPWALEGWLASTGINEDILADYRLADWKATSIRTIHLWADTRPWLETYTCLPGRITTWVFDYARIWRDSRAPIALLLAPSSSEGTVNDPDPQMPAILSEVFTALPQLSRVRWKAWRIVSEKRATPLRPRALWGKSLSQKTSIHNLLLAGDWLDPELPPTVEAAVRAGEGVSKLTLKLV